MPATLSRFFFRNGDLCKIVHPSSDAEVLNGLHDEAGQIAVNVLRTDYAQCGSDRDVFVLLQPVIAQIKQTIGDILTQRINLTDQLQNLQADINLRDTRIAQWPSPTPAQQLLINAATAKVVQDLQDIQTTRDNIAALKAQLN